MKTIGLIGGMSWESTALYYRIINRETTARLGGLHSADILLHSVDFAPIEDLQRQDGWEETGRILAGSAHRLVAGGADLIGITSNTMHLVLDRISAGLEVPFIHIADPTADALLADGFTRVGLLGTRFTMEMPFYKDRLKGRGLDVLVPEVEITNLNGIIYEELVKGIVRDASREVYVRAIERLAARGAEAVILGCTEIGMLIDDASSPLPVFDTTDLHARALVTAALA